MEFKIYKVNAAGIENIRQFMTANHRRPEEATTDKALARWAMDAEVSADVNEGDAYVEIPAEDCVHGQAMGFSLDESGMDIETIQEC